MSEPARGSKRQHPARATYSEIEDTLASITVQLRSAILADAVSPARANGRPSHLSDPLRSADGRARQVAADLGAVLLDTLGLASTIEWHLHQVQKCTGILYRLTVNNAAAFDLPGRHAATIFDIYNEALSNITRHAGASRVTIALTIAQHAIILVVSDNGLGLANEAPDFGARGLALMRARSQTHMGSCAVTSSRNAGTTVTVSLPIPRTA